MKVLFITRKYPPQIGGMENYSYGLINNIKCEKKIIALSHSQKHLWWFLPYAQVKGVFLARKVDLVYLCDSLLAPIGFIIKKVTKRPVLCTAHGLDITYNNWLYQNFFVRFIKYLDKVICVSKSTFLECKLRKIPQEKLTVIPNGVEVNKFFTQRDKRKELEEIVNQPIENKKIIVSVGRLVKRKGIYWFIDQVFPKLPKKVIFLIIGKADWRDARNKEAYLVKKLIQRKGFEKRIFMLGEVPDQYLKIIYNAADLFVMPNIPVKGDKEGFGLVALEAASSGLPVVASAIEGICEAIYSGKNGFLVKCQDIDGFVSKIVSLLAMDKERMNDLKKQIRKFTIENFSWSKICQLYLNEFEKHKYANSRK